MSRQIETDIFKFMSKSPSVSLCLEVHLPFWRSRGLNATDTNIISHFLFSTGSMAELLQFTADCIERDEPVSWFYVSRVIKMLEPDTQAPLYSILKNYILDQNKRDEFSAGELFDELFPFDGFIKEQQIQAKIQLKERHRQTLLDQIKKFNQSRNFVIEKQTIQKFLKLFPKDPAGAELQKRFQDEDIQRFFQSYLHQKHYAPPKAPVLFSKSEEEYLEGVLKEFITVAEEEYSPAEKENGHCDGLLYFFLFLGDYKRSLRLIPSMAPSPSRDWLQLDLLILAKKFAEALSFLGELEDRLSLHPDFYFAKIYAIAQCHWGLGDKLNALKLMQDLLQINPEYRLSASLVKDWKSQL